VALRRELTSLEQQMSATERAACAEYGSGPLVDLACYDAVRQGVPTLLELLEHRDAQVRGAAVYALAWFAEDASAALPRLHALLASEQDSAVLANAMLSIGLLARLASHPEAAAPLQRYLDHDSLLLRVAAAIGAARAPLAEPIIAALVEAARDSERLAQVGENVLFHEGDLTGYASLMLARFGANDRARIVPVLCQALRGVAAYRSLAVTRALLELVIPRDSATPIREVPADQLDPLLRQALTAIAEYGGWGVNGATFVNYATLVRSYGLPDSQAALRRYLA
jgi:HEAT repeat protein